MERVTSILNSIVNKVKQHKIETIIGGSIVLLILLIIIALVAAPDIKLPDMFNENDIEVVPNDTPIIQAIVEEQNTSDITIISNKENAQADLILESLYIDIKDLYSYAGSIDPRLESAHAILIVRPKEDEFENIKSSIRKYLYEKQEYFRLNNMESSELYRIISEAIMYTTDEYIIVVMEDDVNSIMLNIIGALNEQIINVSDIANNIEDDNSAIETDDT